MKNRELRLAVLLALVGAVVVLAALSRPWVSYDVGQRLTIAAVRTSVRGRTILTGAQELGYVGLAGVIALAATRKWGRVVVGVLVALAGVGVVVVVVHALGQGLEQRVRCGSTACAGASSSPGWAVLAVGGGVLLALAGLLVAVRGPRWVALSSAYQPPAARADEPVVTDKSVWDALDRGEDPTDAGV